MLCILLVIILFALHTMVCQQSLIVLLLQRFCQLMYYTVSEILSTILSLQAYILPDPTKLKHKQVFTTPIVKRSHEPVYDCMATFRGMSLRDVSEEELVFRIYANNDVRFLGGVYFPLPPIDKFGDDIVAEIRKFPEEESVMVSSLYLVYLFMKFQETLSILLLQPSLGTNASRVHTDASALAKWLVL